MSALLLLVLLYFGVAALPWYRIPTPASASIVLNRIIRLGATFAALRVGAFLIAFHTHGTGRWELLRFFLGWLVLFPEVVLIRGARGILTPEQNAMMVIALCIGSFVLSMGCVLVLQRIRAATR